MADYCLVWLLVSSLFAICRCQSYIERCGLPGFPLNGSYTNSTDPYKIEYNCEDSDRFRLIGTNVRICKETGEWDKPIPWCDPNLLYNKIKCEVHDRKNRLLDYTKRWENFVKDDYFDKALEIFGNKFTLTLLQAMSIREFILTWKVTVDIAITYDPTVRVYMDNKPSSSWCSITSSTSNARTYNCSGHIGNVVEVMLSQGAQIYFTGVALYGRDVGIDNCGIPDIPLNGRYYEDGDGLVHYKCNEEYEMEYRGNMTCDGRAWVGEIPKCVLPTTSTSIGTSTSSDSIGSLFFRPRNYVAPVYSLRLLRTTTSAAFIITTIDQTLTFENQSLIDVQSSNPGSLSNLPAWKIAIIVVCPLLIIVVLIAVLKFIICKTLSRKKPTSYNEEMYQVTQSGVGQLPPNYYEATSSHGYNQQEVMNALIAHPNTDTEEENMDHIYAYPSLPVYPSGSIYANVPLML